MFPAFTRLFITTVLFSSLILTANAQPPASKPILIRAGKLYDSEKNSFLSKQEILIQDGVIRQIGPRLSAPKGAIVLDLSRHTVAPGLIDAHTHLLLNQKQTRTGMEDASKIPAEERMRQALAFAKADLEAGITTVRDVGNSGQFLDVQLRKLLAEGKAPGPTMYVSGPILSPPGGQFGKLAPADTFVIKQEYRVIRGAADARAAVLEHLKQGVNVIKVCMNTDNRVLAPEEIKAIVATAHENGIPVTAHATYDESARDAVLAGVDGIEHGYALSDSTLILMAKRGAYVVPTDVSREKAAIMVAGIGMKGKEAEDYIATSLNTFHDRIRRAREKGVMIVAGSDYYFDIKGVGRGEGSVDVVLSYFEAGLSAADALRTATYHAAKALGILTHTGILKKGMKADLVAFDGDLEQTFPRSLTKVKTVIKGGKMVYQAAEK
ncbi:amidohydrolase family protein [Larkinella soli]|uniref:amidohydrolase family protein n=1 Tax=Larkinella soli TaxID=1770527 RepID=UPI000FFCBDF5|nr:amidohydrolase family protein [Larkinella soli]